MRDDWNQKGRGNNEWKLNKAQRMQLKALACVLGLILIVLLLIGRLVFFLLDREEPEVHVPIVRELTNVWIMEVDENGLKVFQDGEEAVYPFGMTAIQGGEDAQGGEDMQGGDDIQAGDGKNDKNRKKEEPPQVMYTVSKEAREQVADITLTDECVTQVQIKNEKINGRLLRAGAGEIELEGLGKFPVSSQAKGYRLYDSLAMCTVSDLMIGYDFTDFVVENGEICAFLMAKEEAMEYIRVLLKNADYGGRFHDSVTVKGDTEYVIRYGSYDNMADEVHCAGEEVVIDSKGAYFQSDRIYIIPSALTGRITLGNVNRSQGAPSYRGTIELVQTKDGMVAVNEVLLEEYLYSVVPSEMPSSYPQEALKAQAICARTYAYSHMMKAGYPQYGAHVDDSTSYQVYNNILEQESTTTAAKETYGQLLYTGDGKLAGTYYYSTSCGMGSDATVWGESGAKGMEYLKPRAINQETMEKVLKEAQDQTDTESVLGDGDMAGQAMMDEETFASFIKTKNADDFEVSEGWYRWTYTVPVIDREHMLTAIQKRYEANSSKVLTLNKDGEYESCEVKELGNITNLYIAGRGSGGVAQELVIETDKNTIKILTEHNIRYVLNDGVSKIFRQDGSEIASPNLLPSAFFVIDAGKEKENVVGYTLTGGGFGHGVGMSQNGARSMAKAGYSADEILQFFYEGCSIRNVYAQEAQE